MRRPGWRWRPRRGRARGAGGVERQIGGKRERRQPGRLDRVEVAVEPGLVLGLPVPAVDLRSSGGERADLRVVGLAAPSPSSASPGPRRCRARRSRASRCEPRPGAQPALTLTPCDLHRAIVQGSGLRTATTSRRRSRKREERAPRPVLKVARGVAELPHVLQPPEVQGPPERLARDADDRPGAGQPGERLERGLGIVQVLHHLAAEDQLGGVVARRSSASIGAALKSTVEPRRVARRRASSITSAETSVPRARRPAPREHAAASSPSPQPTSCTSRAPVPVDQLARSSAQKPRHQPALDRIARPVLVVDVAAGDRRRRRRAGQPPTSLRCSARA